MSTEVQSVPAPPPPTPAPAAAPLTAFDPPANWNDFPPDQAAQEAAFRSLWSTFLDAFTQAARVGNPWSSQNDQNRYFYFDPLQTPIPSGTGSTLVSWGAFPNRLNAYVLPQKQPTGGQNYTEAQVLEFADNGTLSDGTPLPTIPTDVCPTLDWSQPTDQWIPYGPPGPRGWQDEYCEWSVTRNAAGQITRVDFTCENPEYWLTLWQVDPTLVCSLYQQYVNPAVQLADLYLVDSGGNVVNDPTTGLPAYDVTNKWNSGTVTTATGGGAMHLTSPPNTLPAEIYLAAAATLERSAASAASEQSLICCSNYGQPFRNSDPHIGFTVNQVAVNLDLQLTLANPVGLYIQDPDFGTYKFTDPDGNDASQYWILTRGHPGGYGLHAVYDPSAAGLTVSDISINGAPIEWASQIVQTFKIGLHATAIPSTGLPPQQVQACPTDLATPLPSVLQLIGYDMLVAGSASDIVPCFAAGTTTQGMALLTQNAVQGPAPTGGGTPVNPALTVSGTGVTLSVSSYEAGSNIHIPGQTYPSNNEIMQVTVTVDATAEPGLRSVSITNPGGTAAPAAAGVLNILPAAGT